MVKRRSESAIGVGMYRGLVHRSLDGAFGVGGSLHRGLVHRSLDGAFGVGGHRGLVDWRLVGWGLVDCAVVLMRRRAERELFEVYKVVKQIVDEQRD